jgi:hypothetical protein
MKTTYLISYDSADTADYDPLYKAIKSFGAWAHITESLWAVKTEKTAVEIRDRLLKELREDSRILVVKSGVESAWRNPICSNQWLKEHL